MRIKKLELKNFRGFEDLTIDFPEGESGLAVFVGVNGSGKTSVLEGMVNLLENFAEDVINESHIRGIPLVVNIPLQVKDVNRTIDIDKICEISCHCSLNSKDIILTNNTREGYGNIFPSNFHQFLINQFSEIRNLYSNKNWEGIPVLSFYSSKRFVDDKPSLNTFDLSQVKPHDTWNRAFEQSVNFNSLFEWFRNSEDVENQKRLRENNEFRLKGLQVFRKILPLFLDGFSNPYINREGGEEMVVEKDGLELSISNLSSGERMLIAITFDIAMRLQIANPNLTLEEVLQGEGVVLIDEIEQHLHPGWQRTIIPNLRRTFPNIQFIVTTHSPQVISTLQKENVFILNDFQLVKDTPHTYGRDANSILWEIFGVEKRTPESKKEFEKLYRLMDDPEKNKETEKMLRETEAKYGYYDPEVIRAREQFEFLNED